MDPLGTITAYFPFIDDETRTELERIMEISYDYSDFSKNLNEAILAKDCSDLIVYFAIHHSALLFDFKSINLIGEKYFDSPILQPTLFFASAYQGNTEDLKKVRESVDNILVTDLDDWFSLEMRFLKFEADMWEYPQRNYDIANLDAIFETVDGNTDYNFYEATLYDYLSIRAHIDGDTKSRALFNERAIDSARKNNDLIRLVHLLTTKADIQESEDRSKARELLEEAIEICNAMGNRAGYATVLEELGEFEVVRGEYNRAIEHYEEVISIRESLGIDNGNNSLLLSTLYNVIDEFDSGFEWAKMAEDQFRNRPLLIPRAILNQVWALIRMKKTTEALILIDTTRETILKSGREILLAWLHFVTGLLEIEQGDFSSAFSSIEEALKIYEKRTGALMIQVIFLHHMAQIEVSLSDITTEVFTSLALLEERALSEDLPGILGQVLLLKAEIALIQTDDSRLREVIQQLTPIVESESTSFLRLYYDRLMKRV